MYFDYPVIPQRNKTHDIHDFSRAFDLKHVYEWYGSRELGGDVKEMWVGAEACMWTERARQVRLGW